MPLLRWLSILFISSLVAACGGGGSLDKDTSTGGSDETEELNYVVSVQGYSQSSTDEANSVTADEPLTISAMLTNSGAVVVGEVVNFSLNGDIGSLDPVSGTVLTNTDGVASITLTAGDTAGAGIITATYINGEDTYSDSFGFTWL